MLCFLPRPLYLLATFVLVCIWSVCDWIWDSCCVLYLCSNCGKRK